MNGSQPGKLPPCELSSHCLRLLDDLANTHGGQAFEESYATSARDLRDQRHIVQMRAHVPDCPTCSAALARAQALRANQRALLRRYLDEGGAAVPSTTECIIRAVREEEQDTPGPLPTPEQKRRRYILPELFDSPFVYPEEDYYAEDARSARTTDPLMLALTPARRWLRNGLALATVAILIFSTIGIFGHFIFRQVGRLSNLQTQVAADHPGGVTRTVTIHVSHESPASPAPPLSPTIDLNAFQGWNGLVLVTGAGAMYNAISTYNYSNGHSRSLAENSAAIRFDGVSPNGQNILYQVDQGGRTLYYTLNRLPMTGYFYDLDDENALNAIWMPDNLHVLVSTLYTGVIMVDTRTGQAQPLLPDLKTAGLKFFRGNYLYFLGSTERETNTLFRVNVHSGIVQQVTGHSTSGDFWLSPDGSTVYYKNAESEGRTGIYAVSSDGERSEVIRPNGQPIGYAADNSLVIMRQTNHTFEVVQLGTTPGQDHVLLSDLAPGASSLCDPSFDAQSICDTANVALSPYSHALVAIASYPDGSREVWSDDLVTGRQFVMMAPQPGTSMMVPGWDTIPVA